jgi:ribonucleoside-diphosphate reductase alpha chain
MLGLSYNPEDERTRKFVEGVFKYMRDVAYRTSIKLAREKGVAGVLRNKDKKFRAYMVTRKFFNSLPDDIKGDIIEHGIRNITLLSIAPTGSISNLLGVSSGIEPLFAVEFTRRHRLNGKDEFVNYVHPAVVKSRQLGLPDSIWETAYQVTPKQHLYMQALIQKYVDSAISKTVNMPVSTTVENVEKLYALAHNVGIKGISVYVDGSREEQVLYEKDECPVCLENGNVVMDSGCKKCLVCDWSVCVI